LCELIQKTTFPGVQGTPYLNNVAAKAVFFREALSDEYKARQFRIIENARALAERMLALGHDVLTEGTDTHMVLINVASLRKDLTGVIAQKCLEDCGIIVNKNRLPYDTNSAAVASGIRLGTPVVTRNGMGSEQMSIIAGLVDSALRGAQILSEKRCTIDRSVENEIRHKVIGLCRQFPMR
jgi:glycine hydroxymethyltransferase